MLCVIVMRITGDPKGLRIESVAVLPSQKGLNKLCNE